MPPAPESKTRRAAGSLRARADGSWEISIYNQALGKRVYETVKGTKTAAEKRLRALQNEKDEGTLANAGKLTTGAWLYTWLADYAPGRQQPSTLSVTTGYTEKWVIPTLGRVPLGSLSAAQIQAAINGWSAQGLAPRSVHRCYAALRSALNKAVAIRLLARAPHHGVELPRIEDADSRALSLEQTRHLLATIAATPRQNTHQGDLYVLVLLAVTTALRKGELLALCWDNVDWERACLRLTHSLKRDGTLGSLKSKSSRREVTLPAEAVRVLQHHKGVQAQRRLQAGRNYQDQGLLFATQKGGPWSVFSVNEPFNQQVADAALPPMHFHDLRHSHASQLLEAGENIKVVSERLGHSKPSLTLNIYSHALPGAQTALAERYERLFQGAVGE